jgi:DNA repair protein RecN (Recombination protein N)
LFREKTVFDGGIFNPGIRKILLICSSMLNRLSVQNYAIIDQLELDFAPGLNIITGETGAGKSIIAGALGLILGKRADAGSLMKREKKCIVEGLFSHELSDHHVTEFLKTEELDEQDELVVRREIAPNGKSRAFVNDSPVNLTQLNILSNLLVDLHQQFDTQELGEAHFQTEVLDALAGNAASLKILKNYFLSAQDKKKQLEKLQEEKSTFLKEYDYNKFQFTELDEAGFKTNELEELEQELKMQTNAEGIKNALVNAYYELEASEEPLLRKIKSIIASLQTYTEMHKDLPSIVQRLQSSLIELQDIAADADRINDHISADAAAIEKMNERLSTGYKLLKKHAVKTTAELLGIRDELNEKLQAVLNIDDAILMLERSYEELLSKATGEAEKISKNRKAQIKPLEEKVNKMLAQVGMPNARLKISIEPGKLSVNGCDQVDFLFDANKSNQFQPLRKVASGGELSRLMLCIKSLVADSMDMPTLIFDEIDSGISGEAARQVGLILKSLSTARQVICITHQPQIAGKGEKHFFVYKELKGNTVTTGVRTLNTEERITAIAKMLGGEKPTAAALQNAREMVMN